MKISTMIQMKNLLAMLAFGWMLITNLAMADQNTVVAWGDSLTQGAGGIAWTTQFQQLSGLTTFNEGVGGQTSTQIADRFYASPNLWTDFTVIWAGRNNYMDPASVEADIAGMVGKLNSNNYLILGITNGSGASYEAIGGWGYSYITGINSNLANAYGNHFLDIRNILVNSYDPNSAQDVSDFSLNIVPSSLRSDSVHLNTAGYGYVAEAVFQSYSTITAVPEPETYAMLLAGLGVIGSIAARRKSKQAKVF